MLQVLNQVEWKQERLQVDGRSLDYSKMNERRCKRISFPIQMWLRLWFIRDRVTWRTQVHDIIFWEKRSFANVQRE
jgi:hypothetical protein